MNEANNDITQISIVSEVNNEIIHIFPQKIINVIYKNPETSFDFIKEPEKLKLLIKANEALNISKSTHNRLIFVYTAPKVGSTSVVSSLRIFGSDKVDIIHIHDEEMLKVLAHIQNISINELILFNKYLGKDVYVINVYRSPIELKISTFFEKIGAYHFNDEDNKINRYNVAKVINRFNNIFPHIGLGDHFIDKYNIFIPEKFDYKAKYLLVKENNINYITLRLSDSELWGNILTNILGFKIFIVKDYESANKPIKYMYNLFKNNYRIPKNLLIDIMQCKNFNYYYSGEEKTKYYNEWLTKSTNVRKSYSLEQYKLYEEITIENSHFDYVQFDHYRDEGCICKACNLKRAEIASKIMRGIQSTERLVHIEAKTELLEKRVAQVNKINQTIHNIPPKVRGKDFKHEMSNVVKMRRI